MATEKKDGDVEKGVEVKSEEKKFKVSIVDLFPDAIQTSSAWKMECPD